MTKKVKTLVSTNGNIRIVEKTKKHRVDKPNQKDSEVTEYHTPILKHLGLGRKTIHRTKHVLPNTTFGTNPVSHSFRRGHEVFDMKSTSKGVIIRGSSLMDSLNSTMLTTVDATMNAVYPIHPRSMNSYQLDRISQLYQKFIFRRLIVKVISQQGTTVGGLIFGTVYSSNETIPALQGLALKKYLQASESFQETNVYKMLTLKMPQSMYLPAYNVEIDVPSTSIQGTIVIGSQIGSQTYIGDVVVDYEIEFYNMTSPSRASIVSPLVIPSPAQNLAALVWQASSAPPFSVGIYYGVAQFAGWSLPIPTVGGGYVTPNTPLYYMCTQVNTNGTSYWKHIMSFSYESLLANLPITFVGPTVPVFGNIYLQGGQLRNFTNLSEDPLNVPTPVPVCEEPAHGPEPEEEAQVPSLFSHMTLDEYKLFMARYRTYKDALRGNHPDYE